MRYETKYKLTYKQYLKLYYLFSFFLEKDKNMIGESYPIFSIYFDTNNLDFYYDKIDGHYYHIKLRARKYSFNLNDDSNFYLEAKLKKNELGSKYRFKSKLKYNKIIKYSNWNDLRFKELTYKKIIIPIISVFYNRTSLENNNGLRITFDKDILAIPLGVKKIEKSHFFNNRVLEDSDFFCLMEIKYQEKELPNEVKQILFQENVEQVSFSKYTEAIDYLRRRNIYGF